MFEHDGVIKGKHFPRYWPFVRGIQRGPLSDSNLTLLLLFAPNAARSSLRSNEKAARGSDLNRTTVPGEFPTQRRGSLMFSLICTGINGWVNNGETGDLRRYRVHYDISVMSLKHRNDPGDKAGCFTKVLSDVMEKNAPVKSKVINKLQIPYMNSKLRKPMHERNMLWNRYKKGLVEYDVYRMQWNIMTPIHKKSQATYFNERCAGCVKNRKSWKTTKPFLTSKQPINNDIILKEDDKITTH